MHENTEIKNMFPFLALFAYKTIFNPQKTIIVHLSQGRRPSLIYHIFDFSSDNIETWQEARSQHPLPSLCFSDRSEK